MGGDTEKKNVITPIKIFSNDDGRLKEIGHVLSSEIGRQIYSLLIQEEMNASEIQKVVFPENSDQKIPHILHYLKKMTLAGLLHLSQKPHPHTGKHLIYYRAIPTILIVPENSFKRASTSQRLYDAIKDVLK